MTQFRNKRKLISEINMVPFIEIMMVMLVACMVSVPMLTQGVKVELSKTSGTPIPLSYDAKILIISVQKNGQYFIDLGGEQHSATGLNDISRQVRKIVSARPETQILIKGDKAVQYNSVIVLMARLQDAGVHDVSLMTDPESGRQRQ